jgi:hypothetical protein
MVLPKDVYMNFWSAPDERYDSQPIQAGKAKTKGLTRNGDTVRRKDYGQRGGLR